jgi:hypothetical protein
MLRRARLLVASALVAVLSLPVAAGAVEGGRVAAFGGAPDAGSSRDVDLPAPIIGIAASPSGEGYWQVGGDGGVRNFGDAGFHGSMAGKPLTRPVVGMAPTPTGRGYWLVASDGGIFTFGDAGFHGSTGAMHLNQPIVGMASTPSGRGYWLVGSDGGIFTFGDAAFRGSTGGMRLNRPIVAMAPTASGGGYWLVATDGGIFNFGDAPFRGSAGATPLTDPVVGMSPTPSGSGYWLATYDGRVLPYGDAADAGSLVGACKDQPVVGIAARRTGGYWLGTSVLPGAAIPAGTHPVDVVALESGNMATLLRLRQACQPRPAPRRGHLSHPLPGARVSSSYGQRIHPIYRRPQLHAGTDFAGGTRILAAADGTVVHVAGRQGYGTTTIIEHGDGTATVYAHQSAVSVRVGQAVRRGQAIGTVGRTGYATGDHLHFEVRVHGMPSDPTGWL